MRLALAVILCSLVLSIEYSEARADDVGVSDIVNALDPHTAKSALTRSFKRGVKVEEAQTVDGPPSINLYVNFEFDSADLTADSQITLDNLGKALSDPRLKEYSFQIAGHTDAKGTDEYNQALSERRAATVREYLINKYQIPSSKIQSRGYGESKLLDPEHPEDGINRRVQIVNLSKTGNP